VAVGEYDSVKEFGDWYERYELDDRDGSLAHHALAKCAARIQHEFRDFKREMDARVENYDKLVRLADAEVATTKPDLANVSSGEIAGMVRRMARNLVQNTPNVEIVSVHDDESAAGVFVKHILKSKIIGDDQYSNDMQQNLFASAKTSITLGFDCVIPALTQDAGGSWRIEYDTIHYRDVFPEPGAKDIRKATSVYVRRYLTKGEIVALVRRQVSGWDPAALKTLLKNSPPSREQQSVDHQTKKHGIIPKGYEIITWYNSSGDHFLTFEATTGLLLRIEHNKHPLKEHPVFFLVLEKDENQPLGKSQVELVYGRQEFQDLMLNGAMKMWYRNINPSIIGYGMVNGVPNLSPGKFTNISNPNARIEPFEVNTQTLLQFNGISQQNAANMVQLVGAADQQMASQSTGGMMSQTPQGVEAQQQMVDITTNNYQKAIEGFFSRYCSYALTLYFHELKGYVPKIIPTADARRALLNAGLKEDENFNEDGSLKGIEFDDLAKEYWVRTVPGSLVEMEDEKQLRILNELFVPLSQAMPALAAAGDQASIQKANAAMMFIIERQIELSGSAHNSSLKEIWKKGVTPEVAATEENNAGFEVQLSALRAERDEELNKIVQVQAGQQDQLTLMREALGEIGSVLGVPSSQSPAEQPVAAV